MVTMLQATTATWLLNISIITKEDPTATNHRMPTRDNH